MSPQSQPSCTRAHRVRVGPTWNFYSVNVDLLDKVQQSQRLCHLRGGHVLPLPPERGTGTRGHSRLTGSEAPRGQRLPPEGVPHPVPEADEALLVLSHQVARVEVDVSLHKHVSQQLFLRQTFASSVAKERA